MAEYLSTEAFISGDTRNILITRFSQLTYNDIRAECGCNMFASYGTYNSRRTVLVASTEFEYKTEQRTSDDIVNCIALEIGKLVLHWHLFMVRHSLILQQHFQSDC